MVWMTRFCFKEYLSFQATTGRFPSVQRLGPRNIGRTNSALALLKQNIWLYDIICIYNIWYNLCKTQIHCQWAHWCHKDKMGVCGVLSQWRIACHVHCSTRPLSFIFPLLTMSRSRPASVFRVWHNTGLDFLKPVLSRMRLQSGQDAINIHQLETFV